MSKTVYSAQRGGFQRGFSYRNPRYFTGPLGKPEQILVVGNWPEVVAAYEAIGTRVIQLSPGAPLRVPGRLDPPKDPPAQNGQDAGIGDAGNGPQSPADDQTGGAGTDPLTDSGEPVEIPENWRELPWQAEKGALTLPSLAAQVSKDPIKNKPIAIAAIEAYLEARKIG